MIKNMFNKSGKKYVIIILLNFFGISNVHSQETNHPDLYLKGSVKSYIQKEFWAKNDVDSLYKGELAGDEYKIVQFTRNGKISEIKDFNPNDKFLYKTLLQYDSKGHLTSLINSDSINQFLGKIVYIYDDKGNVIQFGDYIEENELVELVKYELDENGNTTSRKSFTMDDGDSITFITKYKYDDFGNKIEEINYDLEGLISDKILYKYKNDKVSEMNGYDENDKFWFKNTYNYDPMNNIISFKVFFEISPYEETETIVENGVEYTQVTIYSSDELSMEKQITYTYTYDSNGNWITKVEYEDDSPVIITERKIIYY